MTEGIKKRSNHWSLQPRSQGLSMKDPGNEVVVILDLFLKKTQAGKSRLS